MIVYQTTKAGFLKDVSNGIEDIIRLKLKEKLNLDIQPGSSEYMAWSNSLGYSIDGSLAQRSLIPSRIFSMSSPEPLYLRAS